MNGDLKRDLVTTNIYDDSVSVLLGDGNGSFTSRTNYSVGDEPDSVALGDLDNDGDLDIAFTAGYGSDMLKILSGDGFGSFELGEANYEVGDDPASLVIGDLEGDGDLDIVTANAGGNSLSLLLSSSDGSFSSTTYDAAGKSPLAVALGDVDEDDDQDILFTSKSYNYSAEILTSLSYSDDSNDKVSVLLHNDDGSFTPGDDYAVGDTPESLVVGDLDGDGDLDIVTANAGDDSLSVLLGDGDGSFISESQRTVR